MKKFLLFFLLLAQAEAYEKVQIANRPELYLLKEFLSVEECDYLIEFAKPKLNQSQVVFENGKTGTSKERKSEDMRCPIANDPFIFEIEKRLEEAALIPISHAEPLQIIHYFTGGEFKPHFDCFECKRKSKPACKQGGDRQATIVIYLHAPLKGGETVFPNAKLFITPVKGDAILFYSLKEKGGVDTYSLHAGAPVLQGEKWIANCWFREKAYR